ncbi:MAG TPA: RDD family protein [Pyrinomonadaceae bacterium]|nr:RDD family protein [Pyrinomonadaceae bacterium]
MQKSLINQTEDGAVPHAASAGISAMDATTTSTLIEFPGMSRARPAWRKQLSQRVREIQEQRAREAAETEAANRAAESVSCALPSGQLELVPDREQAPMNPIVSKALERVDRARRGEQQSSGFAASAAAPAYTPEPVEPSEPEIAEPVADEVKPKLTIVSSVVKEETLEQAKPKPVRLITDSIDDRALSYLENCLSVADDSDSAVSRQGGFVRRTFAAIFDLIFAALLASPAVGIIQMVGGDWQDPRNIGIVAGTAFGVVLLYQTIAIALTGRTVGMRMFSLRVIDLRTRMIPTGTQSLKRAFAFIFSLLLGGLGLIYAIVDRDQRAVHDRFSKSVVIKD